MFNLIKKWFKRPIVINFTVEPVSSDMVIGVIKTDSYIDGEVSDALRNAWMEMLPDKKAVVIPLGITLEQLSDADLRKIGLIRADFGGCSGMATLGTPNIPKDGSYLLDEGERVIKSNSNSDIAKYLKDSTAHKR